MGRLLRFWSLSRREKLFLCESAILLLFSYLSVKTVAFKRIDSFLGARWNNGSRGAADAAEDIKLINLSLSRLINLLQCESLCLSRSIAAFIMLRRRGIPAVIVAGVKFSSDSSFHAHAWVDTCHSEPKASLENSAFTPVMRIGR